MDIKSIYRRFYDGYKWPPLSFALIAFSGIGAGAGFLGGAALYPDEDEGLQGKVAEIAQTEKYSAGINKLAQAETQVLKLQRAADSIEVLSVMDPKLDLKDKAANLAQAISAQQEEIRKAAQEMSYNITTDPALGEVQTYKLAQLLADQTSASLPAWFADGKDQVTLKTDFLKECRLEWKDSAVPVAEKALNLAGCSYQKEEDGFKSEFAIGGGAGGFALTLLLPLGPAFRRAMQERKIRRQEEAKNKTATFKVTYKTRRD